MKTYGLTGGIGMGKSAAGKLLRERGVPVVDTDELARQLVEPGRPALAEIQQAFGPEMIGPDGRLRRGELARLVFQKASARRKLEDILHPRVRAAWQAQLEHWRNEGHPQAVVVIPLLYETNAAPLFDTVICVACLGGTQRRRLEERGWDAAQIRQRNESQWPVEKKMELAHCVAWSEGTLEVLAAQLQRLVP